MTQERRKRMIFTSTPDTDGAREVMISDYNDVYGDNPSDSEVYDFANRDVELNYDAERANLNVKLDNAIVCIATLGLWNGIKSGYKLMSNNLNNVLYGCGDSLEVYFDGNDIVADDHHHDGTNHYLYRELREDTNYTKLLDMIYKQQEISRDTLNKYTKSLKPYVKEVYGW